MALKSKVTVASVKRKWEQKYNELNARYEDLCKAHLALAQKADMHKNNEEDLREEVKESNSMALERLIQIVKQEAVIEYLEDKIYKGDDDGNC